MHRRSLSNDYNNYSYVPPSQKPHHRNYDPNQHTEQALYSNATHNSRYSSSDSQRQSEPLPINSNLTESISIFDDQKPRIRRQSNVSSYSSGYIPPNPVQRSSVSDVRLATANAMRERLLTDIQDNIIEIDRELSTLDVRPSISNYLPPRFSSVPGVRQPCIHQQAQYAKDQKSSRQNKPKKVYEVVPQPTNESKKTSKPIYEVVSQPTNESKKPLKAIDQSTLHSFVGHYHYGAEIGETEIVGNDPENTDFTSTTIEEIPIATYETSSTNEFLREQSPLPLDRALIVVPIYGDRKDVGDNETTEDFHEKKPSEINIDRSSIVSPLHDIISSDKLNIQDFNLLMQTAPEPKIEIPAQNFLNSPESPDLTDDDVINTMFSKPLKHARLSTRPEETHSSSQPTNKNSENNISGGFGYFFSDFGNDNEGEGEEDLISLDLSNFAVPMTSEMIPDDNTSNTLIRQSQTSLLNPHLQQRLTIGNNDEHGKETESKNNDVTTKDIVPAPSTSPSKQTLPVSIDDNMKTQSTKNNNNSHEPHHQTSKKTSNKSTTEPPKDTKLAKSSFHFNSSLLALEHKDMNQSSLKTTNFNDKRPISGNKQSHLVRQRSSSLRHGPKNQPSNIVSHRQSITSPDRSKRPTKPTNQQKTSVLPVPLNSTDFNNERFPTSGATTPERRNSIPSIDQNILLTLMDIINFDDQKTASSEQLNMEPNSSIDFLSLLDIQHDELIDQSSSAIHEQEKHRLKSVSSLTAELKKPEHDDISLPYSDVTSVEQEDTLRRPTPPDYNSNHEENYLSPPAPIQGELPLITASQPRAKSPSIRHRSKSKQRKCTNDIPPHTHIVNFSLINNDQNLQQYFHTLFSNIIPHAKIHSLNNWYGCINTTTANKDLPFIKSSIDLLDALEYPQLFEQIWCPVGERTNIYYKPGSKIFGTKSKWSSKSDVTKLLKDTSSHQILPQADSLSIVPDTDELYLHHQESVTEVQISRQTVRRNTEPDIRITHSLNWNIRPKVTYSSETDLYQLTEDKSCFSEYHDSEWSSTTLNNYSLLFITQSSKLKDYVEAKFNDEFQEESPPNRPKWNAVSKTRSVNLIYNPKVSNSNSIRRGWDFELRRKRVHKLPPLEKKRDHNETPQLAIEAPLANDRLAIDYTYDHSQHGRSDGTASSRRSSRALVPLNRFPDAQVLSNISRSQRPIHREWYDELNRSHLTHRMDIDRTTNTSHRDSIRQTNTLRELVPLGSVTRNSQNSLTNRTILDSSIRTNRATELRLSRVMDEHHQHLHDADQSMPTEIRGFHLKGTQLATSDDAKIRPLSNVNYQTSERVKNRRTYPMGTLYQHETSSQNSSLLPITEFPHSSFITSMEGVRQLIDEE